MTDLALQGETAPPMSNGEIIFEAPWQNRLFGIAEALCQQGYLNRETFRVYLIREIGRWEAENLGQTDQDYAYFDLFQLALTGLLRDEALLEVDALEDRILELEARPHGHDHNHNHNHDHDH